MISSAHRRSAKCRFVFIFCLALVSFRLSSHAQQSLGAVTGTVKDQSGAALAGAAVKVRNTATNLLINIKTDSKGSYLVPNLPIGDYQVSFSRQNFQTEDHPNVVIRAGNTTTVNGSLQVGSMSSTVQVSGTPLMNQVDTTNGYTVDQLTIQNTPLGTGSFTQLAILSPGVSADFLNGSGSNAGLGNQTIFANGQRDSSNSWSLNAVNANNLFNGKTSSQVSSNRLVLNTGENFTNKGGEIQTSTSVYDAIGQALPTPAPESIQEIRVNTSMYDASQGANSGAHIELTTKSGTNEFHGQIYEYFQNDKLNANSFFYNQAGDPRPKLERNQFGATLGGPIVKDKLFFFVSYQGTRVLDALNGTQTNTVPDGLTNDRSPVTLTSITNQAYGTNISPSQVDPVSLKLLQAKTVGGGFLIPSATVTDPNAASSLGYNAFVQGPSATANYDQGNAAVDYNISSKDRFSAKYYVQNDPTTNPFSGGDNALGFSQSLQSGAQVISLDNSVILSPNLTWEQRAGFTRERAFATTDQPLTPQTAGINIFGSTQFPGIYIGQSNAALGNSFSLGPTNNFDNAGMFQNQWEYASTLGWVIGRHDIKIGANWDHTQLNILNRNNEVAQLSFANFPDFLTGQLRTGANSEYFNGTSNRYYRADTVGAYINDDYKISSNISLTLGVRYDYDGPLSEKYGRLTNFYGNNYQYDPAGDTILNSGVVFAGNNSAFHTPGVSNSTLRANQWGFSPRVGLAWTVTPKLVLRGGFGTYFDRGEFFTYLSPSAGGGYNGPFGVTLQPPFITPVVARPGATFANPFGTSAAAIPPANAASFNALLPNLSQTESTNFPTGNQFGPYDFGGYNPDNKLPYSENWTVDLQYQPTNDLLFSLAYVGNHGVHLVLPVPFNQPLIATPEHPVNGQIYSYGYNVNAYETINTNTGGNTDARVPYIGYSPNSVSYNAEGVSSYNALQFEIKKRFSRGLQLTASYTWSHTLDEQSDQGLFYNGNNPLDPKSGYGNADFDRTHVGVVNYTYELPKLSAHNGWRGTLVNGWQVSGQTILQSGLPYSVYDYSGSVASQYYSYNDSITNPLIPVAPGYTAQSAQLQGQTGVNPGKPVLNTAAFAPPTLAPGQNGVPPCDAAGVCDTFESAYGNAGRNLFRGPWQWRFDFSVGKDFRLSERFHLRYDAQFFNLFNNPSFDTPNNNVSYYNGNNPPALNNPPAGSLGIIQYTTGSPRFIQMVLHLTF